MRQKETPRKVENAHLVSFSRQCSSTLVGFGQGILAKNDVTALLHPPYTPDRVAADFYLFLRLKSALKGRSFCDVTDITKNATEELKRHWKIASRNVSNIFTVSSLYRAFRKITSTINQQMNLYNFHLKYFKTLKTTPTCLDLFRSSSGHFVIPC